MITWNGISSDELGIYIKNVPLQTHPERKYDTVSIPGRNGDLIVSQNAWHNYEQEYDIFAGENDGDAQRTFFDIATWLTSVDGYARLEDSFDPDHYRMAYFAGPFDVDFTLTRIGHTTITFNCKPQRFLSDGSEYVTYYPVSYGGINSSGANTTDEYCYRIEYMDVTAGDTFKASAEYTSTSTHSVVLTVAFYNSSKAFLSQVVSSSGTSQSVSTTVPSGASYARVMYPMFSSTSKFKLKVTNGGDGTFYTDGGPLLLNPIGYTAQPIIKAYDCTGYKVERLGASYNVTDDYTVVTIDDYSSTGREDCVVDSTIGDTYSEELSGLSAPLLSLNTYTTITDGSEMADYPTLGAGANVIYTADNVSGSTSTDAFSSCKIKAGWWQV